MNPTNKNNSSKPRNTQQSNKPPTTIGEKGQDGSLVEEFVPETIMSDEHMDDIEGPEPESPDLNPVNTVTMVEVMELYEEQRHHQNQSGENQVREGYGIPQRNESDTIIYDEEEAMNMAE
ncbi:hypothetical protein S83_036029 [Arachis hypogaea]